MCSTLESNPLEGGNNCVGCRLLSFLPSKYEICVAGLRGGLISPSWLLSSVAVGSLVDVSTKVAIFVSGIIMAHCHTILCDSPELVRSYG